MYPAYNVVAGAYVGPNPRLAEIVGEISAYDLPKFTIDILRKYLEKQHSYKSFSDYISLDGKSDIAYITEKYKVIPEFSDDKNYYFDWGSEQIFSLAAKGVGECSAGLFDMIDVDLNSIRAAKEKLEMETEQPAINELLYEIVFASSRMLLITRGAEPKNAAGVFNDFIQNFIEAELISNIYREIVEMARDERDVDFTRKKETILDLAKSVTSLYEAMDDSLQFKNFESNSNVNIPVINKASLKRIKDFRGVKCPMNFVKTKIELATIKTGDLLEILLDDGEPIDNVPASIKGEGHLILEQKKIENYWQVVIRKS
jgi:sulfite reductase (ferredoxin)